MKLPTTSADVRRLRGTGPLLPRVPAFCAALALAAAGLVGACSAQVQVSSGAPEPPAGEPPPAAAASPSSPASGPPSVDEARQFFAEVDRELRRVWSDDSRASWINQTYITDDTDALSAAASEASMAYLNRTQKAATRFDGMDLPPELARQRHLLKVAATLPAPSDAAERADLAQLSVTMGTEYGKGKYCPPDPKSPLGKRAAARKPAPGKSLSTLGGSAGTSPAAPRTPPRRSSASTWTSSPRSSPRAGAGTSSSRPGPAGTRSPRRSGRSTSATSSSATRAPRRSASPTSARCGGPATT